MYYDDDLLPISALQHYLFCPRQCGLIHLEQAWAENRLTAQGRELHERAHDGPGEARDGVRVVRGLRLASRSLGVTGQADVVELHPPPPGTPAEQLAEVPGQAGRWLIHPVEYKRGRPKQIDCDRVQLCAQAICLEEMLGIGIPKASLFYGQPRRRETVTLDESLRSLTRQTAQALHSMIRRGQTPPPPEHLSACRRCSLAGICMPKTLAKCRSVRRYLARQLRDAHACEPPEAQP